MPFTYRGLLATLLLVFSASVASAGSRPQPGPGDIPPDALGKDREGAEQTISGHRGKVVIVTFWASWCGPCRRELPVLGKFQRAIGREALEVIAINVKEPRKDYLEVVRANKDLDLTWVHDSSGATSVRYGVQALPNMFIIDREGKVAHVHRGYSEDSLPVFIREITDLLPPEVLQRPAGR
ncbi:MAG: TlpA family protein disulfide reductase [Xanthomonadaceae bacterium]|nr:TlpA family protein disulfide reductase [Xanthomonadaceae bacterium]